MRPPRLSVRTLIIAVVAVAIAIRIIQYLIASTIAGVQWQAAVGGS